MPDAFINPGNTSNPLWRQNRNSGPNSGQPIDQGQPDTPLGLDALKQCTYKPNGAAQGFCSTLDFPLHGNVHVLIGNSQGMGSVPWAGNDPIFWMHHCNIDRLWASWNNGPNRRSNPTDATWLNQTFVFSDENGNRVVSQVKDFDTIAELGYTYDHFEPLTRCRPIVVRPPLAVLAELFALPGGPVELGAGTTRVPLKAKLAKEAAGRTESLEAHVSSLKPTEELYVVLRGLRANAQPGVLYHLYLNLPEGAKPKTAEEHYIGAINFFDAESHGEHEAPSRKGAVPKFASFEISDLAKRLKAQGGLAGETSVSIVPAGEPAKDAKPLIGQVSLVRQ